VKKTITKEEGAENKSSDGIGLRTGNFSREAGGRRERYCEEEVRLVKSS